jgi:hypothetical protein
MLSEQNLRQNHSSKQSRWVQSLVYCTKRHPLSSVLVLLSSLFLCIISGSPFLVVVRVCWWVAGGRLGGWDAVRYGLPAIPPSSSTPPSIFNTCYVCILTFGNSNSSATDTNERLASRTSQFHSDTYGSQDRSTVTRRVCTTIPYHDHNHHVHYCHLTLQFQTMNGTFFNFVVACFFLFRRFLRGWPHVPPHQNHVDTTSIVVSQALSCLYLPLQSSRAHVQDSLARWRRHSKPYFHHITTYMWLLWLCSAISKESLVHVCTCSYIMLNVFFVKRHKSKTSTHDFVVMFTFAARRLIWHVLLLRIDRLVRPSFDYAESGLINVFLTLSFLLVYIHVWRLYFELARVEATTILY